MSKTGIIEKIPRGAAEEVELWLDEYNMALFPEERRDEELRRTIALACGLLKQDEAVERISSATGLAAGEIELLLY